tara:strand:- start:25 stop:315 length:291 start_codon:yes stop_codon:yes gene_type:complete
MTIAFGIGLKTYDNITYNNTSKTIKTNIMKKNMGSTDRFIRLFIAVALLTTFYTDTVTGIIGYLMAAVAGVLILTTFISFCPLYSLLGINTCKMRK